MRVVEGRRRARLLVDLGRRAEDVLRVLSALQVGGLCAENWQPGQKALDPTVEIKPLRDRQPITEFVNNVLNKRVDHVIFMSVNGVTSLIDSLEKMEQKDSFLKELNGAMIVAIGPKTERKLEEHGIEANLVSPKHSSEGIVESLKKMDLEGKTVAVLRSSIANNYLRRELEKMGANVLEFPAYESAPPSDDSKVLVFLNDLFSTVGTT